MIRVNVYAEDYGWLFEDLKRHFLRVRMSGFEVSASERPLAEADAWVALRTGEATSSPDLERTVVCIHDLFCDEEMYSENGSRRGARAASGLALCHPEQRRILMASGVSLQGKKILERPLGALATFTVRERLPKKFRVGWVGRNHPRKRLDWFEEAILGLDLEKELFGVSLIGEGLGQTADRLQKRGIDCIHHPRETNPISEYPKLYEEFDCLVITGSAEAGPLPLFEALAKGLPVISTPVGWSPYFSQRAPLYVRLAEKPAAITGWLKHLYSKREKLFAERMEIARLVEEWRLDDWLTEVIYMTGSLPGSRLKQ